MICNDKLSNIFFNSIQISYCSKLNGGHVTTGCAHAACCLRKYSVTILSSDVTAASDVTDCLRDDVIAAGDVIINWDVINCDVIATGGNAVGVMGVSLLKRMVDLRGVGF